MKDKNMVRRVCCCCCVFLKNSCVIKVSLSTNSKYIDIYMLIFTYYNSTCFIGLLFFFFGKHMFLKCCFLSLPIKIYLYTCQSYIYSTCFIGLLFFFYFFFFVDHKHIVYLSTGGTRPVLLNFRACATALLSAALVWPPKESKVERQENAVMREREELEGDEEDGEREGVGVGEREGEGEEQEEGVGVRTTAEKKKKKKKIKKDGDILYSDPLFVPPDWIILIVEIIFWLSFIGFPIIFTFFHGGNYFF